MLRGMSTSEDEPNSTETRAYDAAYHAVTDALAAVECGRGRFALQGALEAIVDWSKLTHAEIAAMVTD